MKISAIIVIFLFLGCQSNSEKLPILSYKIDDHGAKAHYSVTYNGFTNQLGKGFATKDIKDKVFIANFFFTRCPSICPPMRMKLIEVSNEFQNEEDFIIVSHTIDPENDSIEVLKAYADATGIPSHKWMLVRSTEKNIKQQAHQYMTNFKPNEDGTDFYHSSYVALVDKNQQIRGFYNVLVNDEIIRLKTDIKRLLE